MTDERDPLVPPVEALPDLTWARVEKQLWLALDAPVPRAAPAPARVARWRWPAIAAGGIAAAAAVALAWPRGSAGPIGIDRPSRDRADRGLAATPSRIATAGAPTELSFGDADIVLAPRSTLFLGGDDRRGVDLLLERGRARFDVADRSGRAPFVVRAGAVRITVVGTGFTVVRDGDSAQVEVAHGVVEVVAAGQRDLVTAGQLWDHGVVRTGALAMLAPDDVRPTAPPTATPATPATTAPPTVAERAPTSGPAPTALSSGSTGAAPRDRRSSSATSAPAPLPLLTPVEPDLKAAFVAAAALEASAPARAQAAYLRLADGDSAWAAPALFAAARLAFDRGDAANARAHAIRYLDRFPHGRNALDARVLLARLARPTDQE